MILDQAISEVQQICGWRTDKVPQITNALAFAQQEREKPNQTFPWFLRKTNDQAITTVYQQMIYPLPADYIQDSEELAGNMYIYLLSSPGPTASMGTSAIMRDEVLPIALAREDGSPLSEEVSTLTTTPPNLPGNPMSRTVFLKKQSFESIQIRTFGEWPYVYGNSAGYLYDTSQQLPPGVPRDYAVMPAGVLLYPPPDGVYNVSWTYWAQDAVQTLGQANKWLTYAPWVLIGDAAAKICADLGYAQGQQTAMQISGSASTNLFKSTINRSEAGRRRSLGSRL